MHTYIRISSIHPSIHPPTNGFSFKKGRERERGKKNLKEYVAKKTIYQCCLADLLTVDSGCWPACVAKCATSNSSFGHRAFRAAERTFRHFDGTLKQPRSDPNTTPPALGPPLAWETFPCQSGKKASNREKRFGIHLPTSEVEV